MKRERPRSPYRGRPTSSDLSFQDADEFPWRIHVEPGLLAIQAVAPHTCIKTCLLRRLTAVS